MRDDPRIMNRAEFVRALRREADAGRKVVFTNGCFDVLHVGHLRYLEESRALGELLFVGVNSDQSVRKLKGEGRPINSCEERMELLVGLRAVDAVCPFDEESVLSLIQECRPPIITKGGDRKGDIVGEAFVLGYGGEVRLLGLVSDRSSSRTIAAMQAGEGE